MTSSAQSSADVWMLTPASSASARLLALLTTGSSGTVTVSAKQSTSEPESSLQSMGAGPPASPASAAASPAHRANGAAEPAPGSALLVPALVRNISSTIAVSSSRPKFGRFRMSGSRSHRRMFCRPLSTCNFSTARVKARNPVATTPNTFTWARSQDSACLAGTQKSLTKASELQGAPASTLCLYHVSATLAHSSDNRNLASSPLPTKYLFWTTNAWASCRKFKTERCSKMASFKSRAMVTHRLTVDNFCEPKTATNASRALAQSFPSRAQYALTNCAFWASVVL